MRPLQYLVTGLGFLAILIDGFDTQAAAFAGPLIKREFASNGEVLGLILGMSMAGGLIGALLFGRLGDRFGRRPMIIVSLAIISAGSLAGAWAHNPAELALLRFLTGLGLGGAVPNVTALVAEYAPPRARSTLVALVLNGFPLGAMLGSVVGAQILPHYGWRIFFMVGGVVPAVALALVTPLVPESLQILQRQARPDRLQRVTARLGDMANLLLAPDAKSARSGSASVLQIFSGGLAASTILIWIASFLSVLCIYCTINWLPTLISGRGLPLRIAILAVGALNIGSVLGNVVLGRIADRASPSLATAAFYIVGAAFLALIGISVSVSWVVLTTAFAAGVFAFGAQLSVAAITARLYPAQIRATGVGWQFGIGRIGGAVGPVIAGMLLDTGAGFAEFMAEVGGLSLLAGIAIFFLGRTRQAREAQLTRTRLAVNS